MKVTAAAASIILLQFAALAAADEPSVESSISVNGGHDAGLFRRDEPAKEESKPADAAAAANDTNSDIDNGPRS